jgi:hypothetical protein
MSTANATEHFSKSDKYVITELRDPDKRTARLKSARRELKFNAIWTVVLFAIAQVMIFVALYGQLYKDVAAFFWATPSAMSFLGLSMLGFFLSSKAYTDVKAIQFYEALSQDTNREDEKQARVSF